MASTDPNLDPSATWSWPDGRIFSAVYDSLYGRTPDGNLVPALAEGMPEISEEGRLYRIRLRGDARFHDDPCFPEGKGRAVRPEDVVFTLKRIADPSSTSGLASVLESVRGIDEYRTARGRGDRSASIDGLSAQGDRLEIRLARPFPAFVQVLAMPYLGIVPPEAVERYGPGLSQHPVGSGPFRIQSYSSREVILRRVDSHWRWPKSTQGIPDGIVFRFLEDDWLGFKRGELDVISLISRYLNAYVDEHYELKSELRQKGYKLSSIPPNSVTFLAFNHEIPLLQNVHLRRAIRLAIPWQQMTEKEEICCASLVPQGIPGYLHLDHEYDPKRAREELVQAGFPEGRGIPNLAIRYGGWGAYLRYAAMLQDALREIGISVRLEYSPNTEFSGQHFAFGGWGMDYPEAGNVLALFDSHALPPRGYNYSGYRSEAYDAILTRAATLEEAERIRTYEEAVRWIYDEVVAVPFCQEPGFFAASPRIGEIEYDPMGSVLWTSVRLRESP